MTSLDFDLPSQEPGVRKKPLVRSNALCGDDDTRLRPINLSARNQHFSTTSSHDSTTATEYTDATGIDLQQFIISTLHKNPKDREMLLNLEGEMRRFVLDERRQAHKFPKMSSYNRMLVHRVAAYFGLDHNVDQSGMLVVVNKTPSTRMPDVEFEKYIRHNNFTDRQFYRRSFMSLDEAPYGVMSTYPATGPLQQPASPAPSRLTVPSHMAMMTHSLHNWSFDSAVGPYGYQNYRPAMGHSSAEGYSLDATRKAHSFEVGDWHDGGSGGGMMTPVSAGGGPVFSPHPHLPTGVAAAAMVPNVHMGGGGGSSSWHQLPTICTTYAPPAPLYGSACCLSQQQQQQLRRQQHHQQQPHPQYCSPLQPFSPHFYPGMPQHPMEQSRQLTRQCQSSGTQSLQSQHTYYSMGSADFLNHRTSAAGYYSNSRNGSYEAPQQTMLVDRSQDSGFEGYVAVGPKPSADSNEQPPNIQPSHTGEPAPVAMEQAMPSAPILPARPSHAHYHHQHHFYQPSMYSSAPGQHPLASQLQLYSPGEAPQPIAPIIPPYFPSHPVHAVAAYPISNILPPMQSTNPYFTAACHGHPPPLAMSSPCTEFQPHSNQPNPPQSLTTANPSDELSTQVGLLKIADGEDKSPQYANEESVGEKAGKS